jgi:hypothetical protein
MHNTFRIWLGLSCSANPESEIGNLKWARLFAMVALMVSGTVAQAQQRKKISRLGPSGIDAATHSTRSAAFRQSLRELGYIETQNIIIEYRYAEGKLD